MKKKILAICLVLAMAALAVGGTLAYFTDTDKATNTMTTGNVDIVQNELQRAYDGGAVSLVVFANDGKFYPATGAGSDGKIIAYGTEASVSGVSYAIQDGATPAKSTALPSGTYSMYSPGNNAIDKIVTVSNLGTEAAYVRTLLAFELPTDGSSALTQVGGVGVLDPSVESWIYCNFHTGTSLTWHDGPVQIGGSWYKICECYYPSDSMLTGASGGTYATTQPSLLQIYLSAKTTNEVASALVGSDGKYTVLALTQAAQTAGFSDAPSALDAAFGDVDTTTAEGCTAVAGWFA